MNGKISVLMGIYNCADTLEQAVSSIQNQTYTNWELILCDDGSSDNTYDVANELATNDSRIILLKNEHNLGLNATLNHCLTVATGEYIARMDGDDESLPARFEKQLDILRKYPEFSFVSCPMILFDETGEWGKTSIPEFPTPEQVVTGVAVNHGSVMVRKEAMDIVGGYTEDIRMLRVEDINLWIKLYSAGFRCRNLQEPLYRMRNDRNAFNRRKYKYRINSVYVRILGCKSLHLSAKFYLLAFKPMIFGLVPAKIRQAIRKAQGKAR